jgi:hypothetical protein
MTESDNLVGDLKVVIRLLFLATVVIVWSAILYSILKAVGLIY